MVNLFFVCPCPQLSSASGRQKKILKPITEALPGEHIADLLVEGKVIIELKAVDKIVFTLPERTW